MRVTALETSRDGKLPDPWRGAVRLIVHKQPDALDLFVAGVLFRPIGEPVIRRLS